MYRVDEFQPTPYITCLTPRKVLRNRSFGLHYRGQYIHILNMICLNYSFQGVGWLIYTVHEVLVLTSEMLWSNKAYLRVNCRLRL